MRSMTGFGQASWEGGGRRINVEVRSVNQRFLDVRVSLPREWQGWEAELRQVVQDEVARGKVDVAVTRAGSEAGELQVEINEELARAVVEGWKRLQKRLGLPGEIDMAALLARGEFVRVVERRADTGPDLARARQLVKTATQKLNRAREQEGQALARDMRERVQKLRRVASALRRRTKELVPELSHRLRERVNTLLQTRTVSEERLLQEVALLAERSDVTEEIVRLESHLDRLRDLLRSSGAVGKPIDFLLQEIHREINTIASKSADLKVTDLTLEARGEVEKLREQVQNVE
jgi:uncharacterized protein (TIGR00255 family)